MSEPGLLRDRRQKRIRGQLRDAIDEAEAQNLGVERDKRAQSVRQYLLIEEVEALLDHIESLEREAIQA